MRDETFAPILYVTRYRDLDEAIALHNDVSQGCRRAIFTRDLGEAERFLGGRGSTAASPTSTSAPSGAEIGGAFGGEKDTGGGRESGSDSLAAYMRRATNTINYSTARCRWRRACASTSTAEAPQRVHRRDGRASNASSSSTWQRSTSSSLSTASRHGIWSSPVSGLGSCNVNASPAALQVPR
jgi:hypothetical protein